MKSTIPLGRFAGVTVGAHWSILVTLVVMAQLLAVDVLPADVPRQPIVHYWLAGNGAAVLFLGSLLGHELSHAVLARRYGTQIKQITLWLLGGVTQLEGDPPTPRADGLIAAAGPATSLVLGGGFLLGGYLGSSAGVSALVVAALMWLAMVNLLLGVFNLLPGAPLDGGRVLRAVLWKRYGDRVRANRVATSTGQVLGFVLSGLGGLEVIIAGNLSGLWLILLGWFIVAAALTERAAGPVTGQLGHIRMREVMTPVPVTVPGWWTVAGLIDAMGRQPPRHRVFPVVDFDGRPVGVVSLAALARVPDSGRPLTRVQDAGRPLGRGEVVSPEATLGDVLSVWRPRSPQDAALVVQDGRLVGMFTANDLARTLELVRLGGAGPDPAQPGQSADTARRLPV